MLDTIIKTVNECDVDNEKIEEYIIFADDEIAINISFIYRKYHDYVINRVYNENTLNNFMKKTIFENILKKENENERATAIFCLGEIYFAQGDIYTALDLFKEVVNKYEGSENYLNLVNWSKKNIIDIYSDSNVDLIDTKNEFDIDILLTDTHKFESIYKLEYIYAILNYIVFKNIVNEKTIKKLSEALNWIAENGPCYRDTLNKGIGHIEKCGRYKDAYKIAFNAYRVCKNKKILNISAESFCSIEEDEKYFSVRYDEHIKLVEALKENNMFIEYIDVLLNMFKYINDTKKCEIIKIVQDMMKSIKINSSVLKKSISIYILIKEIYNYINDNKFNNLQLNEYENDFSRYLFYVSYVTDKRAELYESYTNIEVNNNEDKEVKSILWLVKKGGIPWGFEFSNSFIEDFRKIQRENLSKADKCPFIDELNYLKNFINKDDLLYEKLSVEYEKNKSSNFNIMFYGIFSAGKSAVINSILGSDILEEGALPTTSTFTYISNGRKNIEVKSSVDNIPSEEVFVDNDFLENITLIDTPGFEDSDRRRGNLSTEYLNMADAFVILLDATKLLTAGEYEKIEYIKENITDFSRIVFVINKIDFIDDEDEKEEVIKFIKQKLHKLFNQNIEIIEYSSYYAKDGIGNYKSTLIKMIKNIVSFDKCTVPLMNLKNYKIQTEDYIKNEYNKNNNKIIATIKAMEDIGAKINKFQSFIESFSEEHHTYLNNQYQLFKKKRENVLKEKAAKIVTDAIDDAKVNYDYSEDPDKIFDIVNEKINEGIDKYLATTYKISISNIWYEIFDNIKNYLEQKEKIFNYNLNQFTSGNALLSKKYSQAFISSEIIVEMKSIADIAFKYSEDEVYNNTFIRKPEGMSVGFKRFFKGNYDIVCENIANIDNSYGSIVNETKKQCNSRMYSLVLSIKGLVTGNIDKFKYANFKYKEPLEKYSFIKRENNKFTFEPVYLEKIFKIIDEYSEISKSIIKQIDRTVEENKKVKIEKEHLYSEDLKRLSFIENDIKKYSNQVERGIVYIDGELYRTN